MKQQRLCFSLILAACTCLAIPVAQAQSSNGSGKAGGISYMRETNGAWGDQAPNLILDNRNERRSYSLLEAARASLGPKATQPACADRLSPTQREQIQELAKTEGSVVSPKLSHQLLLHQDALLEVRSCIREAERAEKQMQAARVSR
jgi:hypothetical protein